MASVSSRLSKHGLDFADVEDGFDFETALALKAKPSSSGRQRFRVIGVLNGETVAVMIIPRLELKQFQLSVFAKLTKRSASYMARKTAPRL